MSRAVRGFGIGLQRWRERADWLYGFGFAALIGIPGLGLIVLARHLGINAQLDASGLADIWYRYPILILQGIQNGVLEEIVMIGFLLTRFAALHWTPRGRCWSARSSGAATTPTRGWAVSWAT